MHKLSPLVAIMLLAACSDPGIVMPTYIAPIETVVISEPAAEEPAVEEPTKTPIEAPIPEEPKEAQPMINAIPAYPAYIVDQCGTIWGITASLQGCTQKEIIHLSTVEGDEIPSSELSIFTSAGYLYISRNRLTDNGPVIDYYRQLIGSGEVEIVDAIPDMPAESRAVIDSADWLIETVTINGKERTDIYNRRELRGYDEGTKGYGPIIRDMVTAFVVLDNGILWMSTSGAEYCPNNRLSADQIAETGRLWK